MTQEQMIEYVENVFSLYMIKCIWFHNNDCIIITTLGWKPEMYCEWKYTGFNKADKKHGTKGPSYRIHNNPGITYTWDWRKILDVDEII